MDFEEYEGKINEKLEKEFKKILEKEDLSIEEIQFLNSIIANNKFKKLANIM